MSKKQDSQIETSIIDFAKNPEYAKKMVELHEIGAACVKEDLEAKFPYLVVQPTKGDNLVTIGRFKKEKDAVQHADKANKVLEFVKNSNSMPLPVAGLKPANSGHLMQK